MDAASRQAAAGAGSSHTLPQHTSIGVTWNPATMGPPGDACRRGSRSAHEEIQAAVRR